MLGKPFPNCKVRLEVQHQEGCGVEGPCSNGKLVEDPEDSEEQEEPGCSRNGFPCLSPLPCGPQPCCRPWGEGLRVGTARQMWQH